MSTDKDGDDENYAQIQSTTTPKRKSASIAITLNNPQLGGGSVDCSGLSNANHNKLTDNLSSENVNDILMKSSSTSEVTATGNDGSAGRCDDDEESNSPPDDRNLIDNYLSCSVTEQHSISGSRGCGADAEDVVADLSSEDDKQKGDSFLDSGESGSKVADCCSQVEEDEEESCLLGIDCNEKSTVGLVLRIYADTSIRLDGDG